MTQDEIIEMAREAGLAHFYDSEGHCTGITDANLITADKEKNDARLVEMLMPFANLVAAKEREACAKVCDSFQARDVGMQPAECAGAIRARGEQALAQAEQDGDCKKCKDGCPACDARKLQKEAHDLL